MGLPFLVVVLPDKAGLRQRLMTVRAVQLMQRRGIRECVFPQGFPGQAIFERKGILTVDRRPLLRAKAGQWVLAERQARGLCGSVAVEAECMTADVSRAVEKLTDRAARVELLLIPGAEDLQRRLRRETGASLRLITAEQLCRAETLLSFGPAGTEGQQLTLYPDAPVQKPSFALPWELARELPAGMDEGDFCALLLRCGGLRAGEIGVKSRK